MASADQELDRELDALAGLCASIDHHKFKVGSEAIADQLYDELQKGMENLHSSYPDADISQEVDRRARAIRLERATRVRRAQAARQVRHRRTQAAVGQGGFHFADLTGPPPNAEAAGRFSYVYDCGSRNLKLCNAIVGAYARARNGAAIDILFLSHLDDDHINGVSALLSPDHGVAVDTIVMPLIDHVERLVSIGRSASLTKQVSPLMRALAVDQIEALRSTGPRQIILMKAGPSDGRDLEWSTEAIDETGPDGGLDWEIRRGDEEVSRDARAGRATRRGPVIARTLGDDVHFEISTLAQVFWCLKPYVHAVDEDDLVAFERAVEGCLGWELGSFRTKVESRDIREMLVDEHIDLLADAYKEALGDRNLTSLCLYAGLPAQWHMSFEVRPTHAEGGTRIGWLGTGDAELAGRARWARILQPLPGRSPTG